MRQKFILALVCVFACAINLLADEPLPPRAIARLGSYRFYHGPGIECATLSPDGRFVVSAVRKFRVFDEEKEVESERVIVLWDSNTGERVREILVPHAPIWRVVFSPDSKRLAVSYGRRDNKSGIALFDVETGKLALQVEKNDSSVGLRNFSRDGKSLFLVKGDRDALILWNVANAKQTREWQRPKGPSEWIRGREYVYYMVPSRDAKFIASLVDEPPDYSKLPPGMFPPPYIPRPTVLVVSEGETGKPLYRKVFVDGELGAFAFSADGKRFMTRGKKFTAYESLTGKELYKLDAESTYSFSLSPDGRLALVATGASQVRLWDLDAKKPSHELLSGLIYSASGLLNDQVFSADGKTVLLTTNSTLRLFDTRTGKERILLGHRSRVAPCFTANGKTLLTTCGELRQVWDLTHSQKPSLVKQRPRNVWEGICGNQAIAHGVDGRLFVDEINNIVCIRDTSTGKVVHELKKDGWSGSFGRFSPDASRLALRRYLRESGINKDGNYWISLSKKSEVLRLYDTKTGVKTGDIELKNGLSWVVPVFTRDGKTIGWVDYFGDVHLHDSTTGKLIRSLRSTLPLRKRECNDAELLLSPDGQIVIVTTYYHSRYASPESGEEQPMPVTRVFDVTLDKEIRRFGGNSKSSKVPVRHSCSAISPDGRLLAVADEDSPTIRVIEIASGKVRAELEGHRHGVHAMTFSPDGRTLASGGEDGVVYLWNVIEQAADTSGLDARWIDLSHENPLRAAEAISAFARVPDLAVAFFRKRLNPVEPASQTHLAQLFADLEGRDFAKRVSARQSLLDLGELADGAVRRALRNSPSLEMERRLQELLEQIESKPTPKASLQMTRAIEAVERIGTPDAKILLQILAKGAPDVQATRHAIRALRRLD